MLPQVNSNQSGPIARPLENQLSDDGSLESDDGRYNYLNDHRSSESFNVRPFDLFSIAQPGKSW